MHGPTRPVPSLSLNAILAIAGAVAALSVVAIPAATVTPVGEASQPEIANVAPSSSDGRRIQRDATANLEAVGREVGAVFSVVEIAAGTVID